MILIDKHIRELSAGPTQFAMITPFSESVSGNGVISWGLTHAGYDIRLAPEILMFKNTSGEVIDPKRFNDSDYQSKMFDKFDYINSPDVLCITIPAHSYVLGRSFEYLRIPRHLKAHCTGKSTYARAGILINTTPLECGWEGHLTLEIGNVTPCPARLYFMQGISQIEFETLSGEPEIDYADKQGQYQGQLGVTPARVK